MDARAGRKSRLRGRKGIDLAFSQGRRLGDQTMSLLARANGLPFCRAAVAVSAAHGGAVRRNRLKRLCREAFRLSLGELPGGWDFVIMPRRGLNASLAQLRQSIASLAGRLPGGEATAGGRE